VEHLTGDGDDLPSKEKPMADDQKSTYGEVPDLMQEFIAQLRGAAERLEGLTGLGGSVPSSALPSLPPWLAPGASSAAQLATVTTSVAAQRRSIEALQTQLTTFDEQLAVLEQILEPFAEWIRTWAVLEQRLMNVRRGPEAEGQADDS
jgi:hypothetical protein